MPRDKTPLTAAANPVRLRGLRSDFAKDEAMVAIELPGEDDPAKGEFCQLIEPESVARLLPDNNTVLISFFFAEQDLYVLPVRRDNHGHAQVLHSAEGYFRVPDALPQVEELVRSARMQVDVHCRDLTQSVRPSVQNDLRLASVFTRLFQLLQIDDLLRLVEPDPEQLRDLHLVVVPDGPLYLLPFHALAQNEEAPCLYQQVASIRYGLSLRTLELQERIQESCREREAVDRQLRGVAFANPDRHPLQLAAGPASAYLPGVEKECEVLTTVTGRQHWWLHGDGDDVDAQATRENLRLRHASGNVLWLMAHGGSVGPAFRDWLSLPDGRELSLQEPSLRLVDGPASMSRLLNHGFDFTPCRLLHISACLLGELNTLGASKEVLGYIAVLTVLGCRRVVSALWQLADEATPDFTRCWLRALKRNVFDEQVETNPHAFAISFREALEDFRANHSEWDHEFYWAPYTLYGLG
jgi:CHAT domain-containing protein